MVSMTGFMDFLNHLLSSISCSEVLKNSNFSAQDCVKVSPGFAVVSQITTNNLRKNGKISAIRLKKEDCFSGHFF